MTHHTVNMLGGCLDSEIVFNTDALEKIVYEPLWVLDNEEEYWTEYPAQKCSRDWAEAVNYEINYDEWRERITEWSRLSVDEREKHIFTGNTRKIVEGRRVFLEKAVPYLCGYLPDDIGLDIGVYFTAFIPARAFAMGEIVFNVAANYWKNNPDNILNTLVHELYHVGCSNIREKHGVEEPDDPLTKVLSNVQGEGIATYVAYNAQHIFPAPDDKDLEAIVVIEMDVQGRDDRSVGLVLYGGELFRELPHFVIVDECDRSDDLRLPLLPLGLHQLVSDEVPDRLGAVGIPMLLEPSVELPEKLLLNRHAEPYDLRILHLSEPLLRILLFRTGGQNDPASAAGRCDPTPAA